MILCIGDTVPPTTEKSRVLRNILIFIIVMQVFLGLAKLYGDLWSGVAEFISVLVLYCAQAQLNYCNCVIYIFFCMMNCFSILVYFATNVQNDVDMQVLQFKERYYFMVSVVSLTFYIVGIYFTFQAYREFKVLLVLICFFK